MNPVTAADALRALKKFKRLAKQDLLAGKLTDNPDFWRNQATARRAAYDELMELVVNEGVEAAYRHAVKQHAALPLRGVTGETAAIKGKKQALEMFFTIVGGHKFNADKKRVAPQTDPGSDDERLAIEASS